MKFQIGSTLNLRKCGEEDNEIAASIGPNNTKYCENSCLRNASGNTMYPQNASFRRAPWLTRAACAQTPQPPPPAAATQRQSHLALIFETWSCRRSLPGCLSSRFIIFFKAALQSLQTHESVSLFKKIALHEQHHYVWFTCTVAANPWQHRRHHLQLQRELLPAHDTG